MQNFTGHLGLYAVYQLGRHSEGTSTLCFQGDPLVRSITQSVMFFNIVHGRAKKAAVWERRTAVNFGGVPQNDAITGGNTGRQLGPRINEHKLAVRRRDPLSLAFAHAVDCDHRFIWDATEVDAMANTKQAREFLEAWKSNTNSINCHVDLAAHYEGLRARLTDSHRP
ncbi:unnamed protein product [Schistocephalus solidus]|uniref:Uncharacterized protein n=1 Tax=Schistocephalus solidus TaxID=70667 RepID=A0A183SB13_SCHSO|nr:unnamed protein product [Schistocephalus solidus]